jgi:hypothetical protein
MHGYGWRREKWRRQQLNADILRKVQKLHLPDEDTGHLSYPSEKPRSAGEGSLGWHNLPEHIVMTVYVPAHTGVVQNAPVTHHGTGDALGAARREAGQEQLLLGHWREVCHHLLHHWNKLCMWGGRGSSIQSPERDSGLAHHLSQGWWPPGTRQTRDRKPAILCPGLVHAQKLPLGLGLTGVIEFHEAKRWGEVLQAIPLTLVEMSGVQEES